MRIAYKFVCVLSLAANVCAGAEKHQDDPWKKAGADKGLREAFERAIYKLSAAADGTYQGTNPAQRLDLKFGSREALLKTRLPGVDVGFTLTGYGYASHLRPATPAKLVGTGSRMEYQRGGITEWYANAPSGLEQGFTLARRPGMAPEGDPLVIALGVSGGLRPVLAANGDAVLLQTGKQTVLCYAGLHARDARGRDVASRLQVRGREIRLVIEDNRAEYPLVVDPVVTWNQESELTSSNGAAGDQFGWSVSVSGNTAVIGAPYKTVNSNSEQGAAYVFVQSGGMWTQQAELISSDGAANDNFGYSVAVNGNTAVVGAYYKTVNSNSRQGAAYVFVQSGGTWTQQAELTSSDGAALDQFGSSVSVSGNTALVGANNKAQGVAYVFVQSGGTWSQQAELTASDGASGDLFGSSVSVSGAMAVVGAYDKAPLGQGAAYVFAQTGGSWVQQAKLTGSDGAAGDHFGYSVSVSGATALVGALNKTVNSNSDQGAAYVFVQNGGVWSQQAELIASNGAAGDFFGCSVAVSGNTAVVGAETKTVNYYYQGAAYVFEQSGGTWSQQAELTASDDAPENLFGNSVSVSGATAVVGAYYKFVNTNSVEGAAYVFTELPSTATLSASPNPAIFGSPVTLTATVSPSSATGTVTFYDGTTVLGVAPVSNGVGTFTTALLASGVRSLTARYEGGGGSTVYAASLSAPYTETVNAQNADGFIQASGSPFTVGSGPTSVAVADFNGDGVADLAVANSGDNTVSVLLGNGSGGFTTASSSPFAVGLGPTSVAVADFNGDGVADLAVANQNSNNVTVLLGNGSGGSTAASGSPFAVGTQPVSVAVADFNGDGIADLAVANWGSNNVTVLLGNGSGGFAAASGSPFAAGTLPPSVAVGDFNGDGIADLAVANSGDNTVSVLLGNGDGTFTVASGSPFAVGSGPVSVAVADFSGDGIADLAVANHLGGTVTVLLGNGSGGFTAASGSPFPAGGYPVSVAVGDFNGDGKTDLAVANAGSNNVTVLLGNVSGGFTPASGSPIAVGSAPGSVAVADFNGDGKTDLAVANGGSNNVTVLLGADLATQLQITQQTSSGTVGAPIGNLVVQMEDANGNPLSGSTAAVTIASSPAGVGGTLTVNAVGGVATFNNLVFGAANSYTLTASSTGLTSATSASIQIAQATQTITFGALSNQTFGTAPFTVSATATSGLPVSLASLTQSVCTVSGNTVTLVAAGACSIQATQAGNATYSAAQPVNQSFQVTQPAITSTTTTLSASPNPAVLGSLVTMTATISPSSATGMVTFYDGTTVLGIAPVSNGVATFATTLLASGVGSLTARYEGSGSAAYASSLSMPYSETANAQVADGFIQPSGSPFAAGSQPYSVAVGDFNGDGVPDLTVANGDGTMTVLLGNGSGGFVPASGSPLTVGSGSLYSVATGDFNSDGITDLAIADYGANSVIVLLGNGSGGFTAASGSPFAVGSFPTYVAVGDFNGDGNADLAVTNRESNNVTILLGNGSGGFTPATGSPFAVGNQPFSAAIADFNKDGNPDLAVANLADNTVTVLLGNGSGGFTAASGSPFGTGAGSQPFSVAAGDFNGDGNPDLAIANSGANGGNSVTVLLGNGSGGFTAASGSPFAVGYAPTSVAIGDFNGDGNADLAVANSGFGNNSVTVLLGNGLGGFTPEVGSPFAAGTNPEFVAVADFNGDGKADLAVANLTSNNLSVLLGADVATQLQITQQPSNATAGTPIGNVVVQLEDANGNLVSASTSAVTIASTPGGVGGTLTVNPVGGVATFSNLVFSAANSYTLTVSSTGLTSATSTSIQITQASQTITFGALSNQLYGTVPFTVIATASSGLPVSFASLTSPVCTVSGAVVTLVGLGQCTIQATQAGNTTYSAATPVNQSFQVTQASQTITFAALSSQPFGSAPFVVTATASSGLAVSFASTTPAVCTVSGTTMTLVAPGVCTIQATQAGNAEYTAAAPVSQSFEVLFQGVGTNSLLVGSAGGSSSVALTYADAWTASANASFLHIAAGSSSGTGNAVVVFTYDAFSGTGTRSGTLTVAGFTVTVTQAGTNYIGPGPVTTLVSSGLNYPFAVAVDGSANVYIADTGNKAIKEWSPSTQQVTTLVASGLNQPRGVALDALGNIYIADFGDNAIEEWSVSSQQLTTLVSSGLNGPLGVALDPSGNVYIADYGNNAIEEWNVATEQLTTLVSGLDSPYGLAVDLSGNVYIANSFGSSVVEWNASTQQLSTLASGLDGPNAVAVDGAGNVYIAESDNNSIKEWSASTQQVTTLASSPDTGGGAGVGINKPQGVAVDGSGDVYFADTYNFAIREIPNTFVGPASLTEPALAGSDSLLPALPSTAPLIGVFAPTSDQSWLTIGTIASGVVNFSFTANTSNSSRTANITMLGQQITVTQNAVMSQAITFGALPSQVYGTAPFMVSATASSGLAVTFASLTTSVCTVSGATLTLVATGTCTIQATQAGNANYSAATPVNQSFQVTQGTPTVSFTGAPGSAPYEATFTVTATTNASTTAVITASGACSVAGAVVTITAPAGTCLLTASWAADSNYLAATATQSTIATKATPTVTWTTPTAITYGTVLSGAQLDATATYNGTTVAGTFVYTPAKGTVLEAGSQILSVSFTPNKTANYNGATASVPLQVNQATPKITWAKPAAITYGTALSSAQLDATASVPGNFVYTPPVGTLLLGGTQTLSVTFTPTDNTDYATATDTVTITVDKAVPTLTWATPVPITYGTELGDTQLDATASVPGTFAYSPAAGNTPAGGLDTLKATFTPTDTTDYTTATASVTLQVNAAAPTITWSTPAAITYGTALSGTQLDAKATYNGASAGGTFVYTPANGTVLGAGSQTLSVAFTPNNTANYTSASASISLQVNQATPKITWAKPAAITSGTALSATQLDATASVPGTFVYSPPAGTVLPAGTQTLSVTFTPMDTIDYTTATDSVSITVKP